jgi:hypothetical protein
MDQRRAIKLLLRSKPRCFAGKLGRLALGDPTAVGLLAEGE